MTRRRTITYNELVQEHMQLKLYNVSMAYMYLGVVSGRD